MLNGTDSGQKNSHISNFPYIHISYKQQLKKYTEVNSCPILIIFVSTKVELNVL